MVGLLRILMQVQLHSRVVEASRKNASMLLVFQPTAGNNRFFSGSFRYLPIASFRCLLHLLRRIGESPMASFKDLLHLLRRIGGNPIASFKCLLHLLWIIQQKSIASFIMVESFSNSDKFGHRVTYLGASIIM